MTQHLSSITSKSYCSQIRLTLLTTPCVAEGMYKYPYTPVWTMHGRGAQRVEHLLVLTVNSHPVNTSNSR